MEKFLPSTSNRQLYSIGNVSLPSLFITTEGAAPVACYLCSLVPMLWRLNTCDHYGIYLPRTASLC